ncbi:undecaprenyl-diphosphatase [Alicyclobacillus pomorum]|uniref:undecaprenyl-diphosphatase n=1 Tax=Alicyclobacillus pomorum TaxID=204470 RepID=UPI00041374AA|nr:undecaprenyl-diphosphatase [Alicyclobacillus pomorum]
MNAFDVTVFHAVNGMAGHHPILDALMRFFAQYALELYAILFVLAWFLLPKRDIQGRHALIISGLSGVLALLINVVISHIWFRSRPFVSLPKGTFTQLIPHSVDASFPSDHASGSFGFAAATWGKSNRWIRYSFTVLAVVVAFSRIYVGVHWPTDVLASFVVGTFAGRVMWRFSQFLYPITKFLCALFKFGQTSVQTETHMS